MSIQSEIDRLALAKDDLADAITSKGVTVPQGAKLDSYPALVLQIETGDMLKSVYDPQDRSTDIFAAVDAAAAKYEATLTYSGWSSASYSEQQQGYQYAQEATLTALTPDAPTTTASSIFLSPCSREPVGVPETDAVLDEAMALINSGGVVSTLNGGRIRAVVQEKPTADVTLQWLIREPVYQGGGGGGRGGGGGGTQILCGATYAVSVPSYDSVNVALPGVPSSYHLVVGFEASQDGNQDINIFTGAQRMDGQWHAKAYNYGNTIQGKLTWVAFP